MWLSKILTSGHDCVCDAVAKRTSMFDDPAIEIQELTSVVKQDITALNAALSDLQQICDSRHDGANQTRQSSEHSTTVVDTLKSRLMNTTKEFKDVLTLRTEVSYHLNLNLTLYRDSLNTNMTLKEIHVRSMGIECSDDRFLK